MRRTNRLAATPRHSWQQANLCEDSPPDVATTTESTIAVQAYFEQQDCREAETYPLYDE